MAAPRTQKRASANAGKTTAKRRSNSRASSSRTSSSAARSNSRSATRSNPRQAAAKSSRRGHGASRGSRGQARVATLVVLAAVLLAGWSVYPVFRMQYQHEREVHSLEAELEGLKSRNDVLREQVDELKTPEGVEAVARETLGLVKPGEQAYVVTGGVIGETTSTVSPEPHVEAPFWQRALDALFGLN